jgi:hypothetical protein
MPIRAVPVAFLTAVFFASALAADLAAVFAFDATFAVDFFTAVFVLAADFFALSAVFITVVFFLGVVAISISPSRSNHDIDECGIG